MAAHQVNKNLLNELEAMGFSEAQATKALSSGNSSIEEAINWIIDHEIDESPSLNIDIEDSNPSQVSEQVRLKAQELSPSPIRERSYRKDEEEERVRSHKELLNAKQTAEENERKRFISQRKAEKDQEKRYRLKIREKLEQDKLERRGSLGLPKRPIFKQPSKSMVHNLPSSQLPVKSASIAELMEECLRSLRRINKDDAYKVKRAFETLFIYIRNVVNNPDAPKFRKIRLTNPAFQDRVGRFKQGIQFLELCGFEKSDEYLILPKDKMDISLLKLAGTIIQSASINPFFGLLST